MDNVFEAYEDMDYSEMIAPETVKTAENDVFHVTVNDSGTLIISDKESGRVFFEMLTVLVGDGASVGYNTRASVIKHSLDDLYAFDAVTSVPIPCETNAPEKPFLPHAPQFFEVFTRTSLCKSDGSLKISVAYTECGHSVSVRFPTGAAYPTVSSATGELGEVFPLENEVTLTDADGQIFTVKTASTELEAKATEGGDLDVICPSIAPVIGKTRFFELEIVTK